MIDRDKSLIIKIDTLVNKIVNFFKRIFRIKKKNIVEETVTTSESKNKISKSDLKIEDVITQDNILEIIKNKYYIHSTPYEFPQDLDYEEEKKRVFDLYTNVKMGKVQIKELDASDLIKIHQLSENELNYRRKKCYRVGKE